MGAEVAKPKEKTKAKQRYLKAKKERRKKRKSLSGPARSATTGATQESDGSDEDEAVEEVQEEAGDVEMADAEEVVESAEERRARKEKRRKEKKEKKEKARLQEGEAKEEEAARPRKRRKLTPPVEDEPEEQEEQEEAETPLPPPTERAIRTPTPPLPSALPSFPLPAQPVAPARTELASQGLDRALARAQIIDPTLTTSLDDRDKAESSVGLDLKTYDRLKELGITELFAVQTTLLPLLLPSRRLQQSLYLPYDPPSDICVSAPTGSGKTLAYVLPIVQTLSSRIVTRLRALVVLPTRDLVTQVKETFEAVGKGRGLKIGTATGQHSFAHEQSQLVGDNSPHLQSGSSKVDILICTPGRLIDHLNGTRNFSLQHLRYLVIDEADRLLAQSFQDWLVRVLAATRPPFPSASSDATLTPSPDDKKPRIPYPDALAPAFVHLLHDAPHLRTDVDEQKAPSCQKLLFSATLMSDPGRIAALELRDPQYLVVQAPSASKEGDGVLGVVMEKFSMPATLKEHMIVCESSQKPLMLFHLVQAHGVRNALVFTKSAESTQRLVRLFEFFERARLAGAGAGASQDAKPIVIRAYSSDLSVSERKSILEKFKAQEIDLLVCSDLISRGIDISHVAHVVSYDVPVDMRKYVHRVGRTARAGRAGDAWTLVEEQEARYFKEMLKAADHSAAVKRERVASKQLEGLIPHYEVALKELKKAYARD
ncbi:P-loop containing nucleoside triphosphate hydrolase protein [Dentipellis sp. KUC8613]|nr:P-loop containing nucleoside triphosphate hydrolase protein [Dentipellis sp. KUC8613]